MRYRYFKTLYGKKLFSLLLIACILPSVFGTGTKYLRSYFSGVKKDVTYHGYQVGGMLEEDVYTIVTGLAKTLRVAPVDAAVDTEFGGVIPELGGLEADIEMTVAKVMAAKSGEAVQTVLSEIPAKITLDDFPEHAIYRGNPLKQQVTFLINVAWGNEYLPEMLQVLQETEADATFFLVGRWVRKFEELTLSIRDAGFEIANHGDTDTVSMGGLSIDSAREQIVNCAESIYEVCGIRTQYFSPHKGELSENVLKAAALEGARVIMWTVDTVDWKLPGVETMLEKIVENASGGCLILMHPTAQSAEFLKAAIPVLRRMGLEPVSLSELLSPSYKRAGEIEN